MIVRFIVIIMIFSSSFVFSYDEMALANLGGNFNLPSNSLEISFGHRFTGAIKDDPWNTFFGLSEYQPNMQIAAHYTLNNFHAEAGITTDQSEYEIGAAYSYMPHFIPVGLQFGIQLMSDRNYDPIVDDNVRKADLFLELLLQSKPLFNHIFLTATAGYDKNENTIGIGTGAEIIIIGNISIFGEFSPLQTKPSDIITYSKLPFTFGFRVRTYGHQFLFFLGNATGIGTREFLYGAGDTDLKIGFEIERLFTFGKK